MSSTAVRSMHSSQQTVSAAHRLPDPVHVAPYLTHLVTHHGQLTLTPPQNAGRIRKAKTKRQDRDRSERAQHSEEPRFTTAVPPTPSRRLQSAPSPARARKQATVPATARRNDPVLDVLDIPVPDYPPPSFQEAISASLPFTLPSPSDTTTNTSNFTPPSSVPSSPTAASLRNVQFPTGDHSIAAQDPQNPSFHCLPTGSTDSGTESDGSSSVELVNMEPLQYGWDTDRSMGVNLQQRVERELIRQQAVEHLRAPSIPRTPKSSIPYSVSSTHHSRRCSQCGSMTPLRSDGAQSPIDSDDERAEDPFDDCVGPFTGEKANRRHKLLDACSAPSSPSSASPTFSNMTAPWASSVTLSLSSVFSSSHKSSPLAPSSSATLKHKESTGLRKLFLSKGKERSPPPSQEQAEDLDSWEVVGTDVTTSEPSASFSPDARASSERERSSPPFPAIVSRAVGRSPQRQVSPYPVNSSPLPPVVLPEKSPLRFPDERTRRVRRPPPPPPPTRGTAPCNRQPPSRQKGERLHSNAQPSDLPAQSAFIASPIAVPVHSRGASPPVSSVAGQAVDASAASNPIPSHPSGSSPLTSPMTAERDLRVSQDMLRPPNRNTMPRRPSPLSCEANLPVSPIEPAPTITPSTPTTPSGHHYAGRPLPRPPNSPSPSVGTLAVPESPLPPVEQHDSSENAAASSSHPPTLNTHDQSAQLTDLDVVVSRLDNQGSDGQNYEDLLLISDIIGSANADPLSPLCRPTSPNTHPFVGRIEIERRRVLKDGRVKIRLSLLGVTVDKCGICLSQFRAEDMAALGPVCQHS
ncbi:uncharacterized protein FIBRA_06957 [Fibroporia radiculosa]|uniref:Uncharacterized protein n=1 Tax=Fibroporia radiculosa TaxID=599839 RepID=J4HZX3_9APHY|nr:uncharacterized protein FIBRA_06957 [Fibroporia radiculosa]CCM04767.1 predicted protein [Fibroporia radiculosa]